MLRWTTLFVVLGLVAQCAAVLVIDEAPRTRAALMTLFFKPYEESPTWQAVEVRALKLRMAYEGRRREHSNDIDRQLNAIYFLGDKRNARHPCQTFWDHPRGGNRVTCDGLLCTTTLALYHVPLPGRLCKRYLHNGNVYDDTYDVPLPASKDYVDECRAGHAQYCVSDEPPVAEPVPEADHNEEL